MADFTILRLLPLTGEPGPDTPVLVQQGRDEPIEASTLGRFAEHAEPGAPVRVVWASADLVMTRVSLSRKQARHLHKVLPYLLEENLLGEPDSFWFSWGEARKLEQQQSSWPVLAIKEDLISALREFAMDEELLLEASTSDASLMAHRAPARLNDSAGLLLMPDSDRAVPVDADTEQAVLQALDMNTGDWDRLEGDEAAFQAFREGFGAGDYVEMLHDRMRPRRHRQQRSVIPAAWRPLTYMAAAVVLFGFVLLGVQQWRYQSEAEAAQQQAAAVYQQLFPGDRASSGLRRQFQARLNRLGGSGESGGFLSMMSPVGAILAEFREQGVTSKRLHYDARQGLITVDLQADSFETLEQVRGAIGEKGLSAEIATARNEGDGVKARLKVEQG